MEEESNHHQASSEESVRPHQRHNNDDQDEGHERPPPPQHQRNNNEDAQGPQPQPQQRQAHGEARPPPRRNDRNEEEIFGKLKFTMPKFQGEEDPDAYLSWVLKVDKIFRIHNFSEAKKVAMASLEFEGYANVWWEEVNKKREKEDLAPIDTWEEMQEVMHTRFVPTHHKRDLFNKLTQLKQSYKSVEEYYKEMHMTMMSANVDEREEQTMARFLNGLNIPVKRIVEFLPYKNMVELLHQATRAERQVREDLASAKTKTFFAARNAMNASSSIKNTSTLASKDPPKQARSTMKTTSFKPEQSTMSSKASTGSSNITCFKCGAQGHKSFECKNTRVMITRDDGDVEYLSEGEYEALVQAATTHEDDDLEDQEQVLCVHDASPSLVVTKVLTTHALPNEDQRCNIFQTRAGINGKSIKVIIDGGSCHNLASTELCTKLNLPLRKHPHPYHVQWLSDNGNVKIQHTVTISFKIGAYEDTVDCDVVPMTVCHMLLGRPWQYDKKANHDGYTNAYSFKVNDKTYILRPMTPTSKTGSLGSFLDATIAKSRQIENTETPNENAATPVNSPESVEYSSDDLDEDYVELDNDFIEKCKATTDARKIKKLLAEHAVRYKLSPDPKFATSPINIRDKDYDFSLDLSHIAIVEKTPFCGTEKESAVEHMTELSTLSGLFSDDIKMRTYFVAKIFPFSLKDDAKTWYNNLPPGSIKSPKELLDVFFRKYFPASAQHAALQRIYNFDQEDGEKLPEAWARFCSLIRAQPDHDLEKHDLLDIFYSGLTIESRAYLDSCAGCVFRKRTPEDAEELLAKIGRNHDDWSTPEPTPTPIVKKRGMIKLNDEDMREAKKSLKEKGIKSEDVKNLPPIEDICETIPPSSMIEDPLYPEGHPKRVEQDSQRTKTSAPSKKKKKKHKNVVESSEPVNDPNSISISDAETESGNEHEEDNDKNDTPDKEEIEKEPEKPAKNKKYTKEDFITEKHGAVIDCNKGMVTFNVDDKEHTVYFPKRIDKEFQDVFPDELPHGLPPLRGIEHRIDLIPALPFQTEPPTAPTPKTQRRFNAKYKTSSPKGMFEKALALVPFP
ncbi:hypothetical protein QYE76_066911 [Lolium multiflorum]|uniref:CCHC-type domain-containing protein n=1 Tax=Lolium multiflorum TaxID=4521 RepID=A0AAD8SD07_LOLMU|nr:hypothetical protein QYE76_066911 [Lolium multiflorum]